MSTEGFLKTKELTPTGDLTPAEVRLMRTMVLDVKLSNPSRVADQAAHALLTSLDLWEHVKTQPHKTGTSRACRALFAALCNYA